MPSFVLKPATLVALVLGLVASCADIANIGGLCPQNCALDACIAGQCAAPPPSAMDAGRGPCVGDDCALDAGPACTPREYDLERPSVDLMLVVDDAASIAPWWPALNDGLLQFLRAAPADLGVGLSRFDEVCEAQPYSTPIVPIAPLADNLPKLLQLLPFEPLTSTSTVPALDGVLQYARSWASSHDGAHVAVVLLTDAAPGACDGLSGDYQKNAEDLARRAYEGTPSIPTYVVGFGVMTAASSIALAGGTQPTMIGVTPADGEVRDALERVRQRVEPCALRAASAAPLPANAEIVDPALGRSYPVLDGVAACSARDGVYVSDPTAAFPLVACPRTCDSLSGKRLVVRVPCAGR